MRCIGFMPSLRNSWCRPRSGEIVEPLIDADEGPLGCFWGDPVEQLLDPRDVGLEVTVDRLVMSDPVAERVDVLNRFLHRRTG